MSTYFTINLVHRDADGKIERLTDPDARVSWRVSEVDGILDPLEKVAGPRRMPQTDWYIPGGCFSPSELKKRLDSLESALRRYNKRLPKFVQYCWSEGGEVREATRLTAYYKGKKCVMLGEWDGPWAKDEDDIHRDLSEESEIKVRLIPDGADVAVAIEQTTFLTYHYPKLQQMRGVCRKGQELGALIETAIIH